MRLVYPGEFNWILGYGVATGDVREEWYIGSALQSLESWRALFHVTAFFCSCLFMFFLFVLLFMAFLFVFCFFALSYMLHVFFPFSLLIFVFFAFVLFFVINAIKFGSSDGRSPSTVSGLNSRT